MTKRTLAIAAAAGGAALLGAALFLALAPRRLEVRLAGLSKSEEAAYSDILKKAPGVRSVKAMKRGAALDPRKLPDAIVAPMGAGLAALSGKLGAFPAQSAGMALPAMIEAARDGQGRVYALPLQLDQFQVAYGYRVFEKMKIKAEKGLTPAQLEKALASYRGSVAPALLFAGGDDETLLLVVSALCLSRGGEVAYRALVDAISRGADFAKAMDADLGQGAGGGSLTLASLVGQIASWRSKGYLHVEWFRLMPIDVAAYLRQGYAFVALIPLSFRRTIPYESINQYGWDGFPLASETKGKGYLAPMTAIAFNARAGDRTVEARKALMSYLANGDTAMSLANADGEATTFGAAPSPDIQARSAMTWAAESRIVVNGLYRDAFVSAEAAHAFAEGIRDAARR